MMNYSLRILLGLIFFIFLCSPPGLAQTGEELRREIESLKEGQKTIQKELQDIKRLLGKKQPPKELPFKEVVIDVTNIPFKGSETAEFAVIEVSDYQ